MLTVTDRSAPCFRTQLLRLACLCLLVGLQPAQAQEPTASEYAVKAAIVYKIAKFVSWPNEAFVNGEEPLSVCLPSGDPIGVAMETLAGKTIQGRPIAIRRFDTKEMAARDCKILFLSQAKNDRRVALVSHVANSPVLTIGDTEDFVDLGGIVTLRIQRNRVQFAINVGASDRAGLDISAQLLQLATIRQSGSDRQAPL